MRIAFVGLPIAALLLRGDGHEVVWAGVCRRDAPGLRRLRRVLGRDNVSVLPDLERLSSSVRERKPDVVVSWFWTRKVPASFRAIAPLGAIGVHPSLLPRHRGPDPFFWAIHAGDDVTGVTAHELDDDYDTGAILAQRALPIDPAWNAWTLAKKLDRPSLALLREVVGALARGERPPRRMQDSARVTLAPQPESEQLEIRWHQSAATIERLVRAASPWPGAYTALGDLTLAIVAVRATRAFPRVLRPGEAHVRSDGICVVRCGDDALELLGARLESDASDEACGAGGLADSDDAQSVEHVLGPREIAERVLSAMQRTLV